MNKFLKFIGWKHQSSGRWNTTEIKIDIFTIFLFGVGVGLGLYMNGVGKL